MEFQVKLSQDNYVRIEDGSKVNQPTDISVKTFDVNRKRATIQAAMNIAVNRVVRIVEAMDSHRQALKDAGMSPRSAIKWSKPFRLEVTCDGTDLIKTVDLEAQLPTQARAAYYFKANQIDKLRINLKGLIALAEAMGDETI
jgi:hypothetical protein